MHPQLSCSHQPTEQTLNDLASFSQVSSIERMCLLHRNSPFELLDVNNKIGLQLFRSCYIPFPTTHSLEILEIDRWFHVKRMLHRCSIIKESRQSWSWNWFFQVGCFFRMSSNGCHTNSCRSDRSHLVLGFLRSLACLGVTMCTIMCPLDPNS